jgi:ABC-type dipeptide/oligopeptide/nickel transport system ATPase component
MVLPFPVADNLVLNQYYNTPFATLPTVRTLPFSLAICIAVFSAIAVIGVSLWTASLWPSIQAGLTLAERDVRRDAGPFVLSLLLTLGAALIGMGIAHLAAAGVISLLRRVFAIRPREGSGGLTIDENAVEDNAEQLVKEYDIRTPSIETSGGNLSGGNQQKLVVAREFDRKPRLLIAAQPTRGIDVGSIEFIHKQIIKQRDEGAAVLLVSAELDEIMALSDRIAVMYKGQIVDTVPASAVTREELGLLMAGIKPEVGVPTPA